MTGPQHDLLGDDFWDDILTENPNQSPVRAVDLNGFGQAMRTYFPQGRVFVGLAKGKTPLAVAIFGAHVVYYKPGKAEWYTTVGTVPMPYIDWALPRNGPPMPALTPMGHKVCPSVTQFEMWLNLVSSTIMQKGQKYLTDALSPNNVLQNYRFALQVAYDLHMIRATPEMVFPRTTDPVLPWKATATPMTYEVTLLRAGALCGKLRLRRQGDSWTYGVHFEPNGLAPRYIQDQPVQYKHRAATPREFSTLAMQAAAEHLYFTKLLEWLTTEAISHPELRGA